MTDFADWRSFDYANATTQLWVFKKSTTEKKFSAWHVKTDQEIEQLFKTAISTEIERISESSAYSPLAQTNESSCLTHALEESAGVIALLNQVDQPEVENTDAHLKHLKGAAGYLVKFQSGTDFAYAIRRTAPNWRPTIRKSLINAVFKNGELSATPDEAFSFDSYFDFYCFNETIFVASKRAYESTTSDKKAYQTNFQQLTLDPDFANVFSSIAPLTSYIGQNAMQLRRITVIQQKALYRRPDFTLKLRTINLSRNWGLNFDSAGKLIVCANTAKVIMQVLLDHRLLSEVTDTIYDVPNAEAV
jgi:hypothetical protein